MTHVTFWLRELVYTVCVCLGALFMVLAVIADPLNEGDDIPAEDPHG